MASTELIIRPPRTSELVLLPLIELDAAARFKEVGLNIDHLDACLPLATFQKALHHGHLWIAEHQDELIAFLLAEVLQGHAFIKEVDVCCHKAGLGIGKQLIAHAGSYFSHGYPDLYLTTFLDVPWNAPYYTRLGFEALQDTELPAPLREVLRTEVASGLNQMPRIVMRKQLPSKTP